MGNTVAGGRYMVGGKLVDANNKPLETAKAESSTPQLPKVENLEAHLQTLDTADAVKELQARDERKTAAPMYEARLAELAE